MNSVYVVDISGEDVDAETQHKLVTTVREHIIERETNYLRKWQARRG